MNWLLNLLRDAAVPHSSISLRLSGYRIVDLFGWMIVFFWRLFFWCWALSHVYLVGMWFSENVKFDVGKYIMAHKLDTAYLLLQIILSLLYIADYGAETAWASV